MAVTIKTPEEIEKMRVAGRLAAEVLRMIRPHVLPGVTTQQLDTICHDYIVNEQQAIPAPLNYRGFPKSICTSVNHVVCHGIPGDKVLKKGDVINIDITVIKDGFHGDTSKMFFVGEPTVAAKRLARISHECMVIGIGMVGPDVQLGDIGHAIQQHAEAHNCSIVREYCGHGIGREFHEDPQVLHYGQAGTGMKLQPGMTFTIEPMVNAGKRHTRLLPDGWTVVTKDHSLSTQWEHTILVNGNGHEVLTCLPGDEISAVQNNTTLPVEEVFTSWFAIDELDTALASADSPVAVYRRCLQQGTSALIEQFAGGTDIQTLVYARSWLVDQLLLRAWSSYMAGMQDNLALVAVGGYGRNELMPGSDVDLLLLLPDTPDDRINAHVEALLTFLWDISLEVGHSVRTISDCIQQSLADITVATNLMEARLLAGSTELFRQMQASTGPAEIWSSQDFFAAKHQEQRTRHRKFHNTAYKLEPNIKESPGGLRDIQMIAWVANRHFGTASLEELVERDFLTREEYRTLVDGRNLLWRIRFALHALTGRGEDRLLFDYQRTLAEKSGFRDDENRLGVEAFMKQYYLTVMELNRLNEMLLQLFHENILYPEGPGEPVVLNKRFQSRHGFLETSSPDIFRNYPLALLEIFLLLEQNPDLRGVRAGTIRSIRQHRHLIDEDFRNDIRSTSLFMELIRQPRGITHELRRMNAYGILAAYLPAFGKIVGLMQYDLFHVYTVDEHILFVVRNLRRFMVPEFANEFPLCSHIVTTLPKPELLYLAGLFHDIAKGRGGDHSDLGGEDAMEFCTHHNLSDYDTNLVKWLVNHHLLMSTTAQREDISDPLVVNRFAKVVKDTVHLDYLYLLTVADIRATNPEMWNTWKDALLKQLYYNTRRALQRGLQDPMERAEHIHLVQDEATMLLEGTAAPERVQHVWAQLGDEYFLRHTAEQAAHHTRLLALQQEKTCSVVDIRPKTELGSTEIFICARAADELFSVITAMIDQLGLNVVDAGIITTPSGHVLNTFHVLEATGSPITGTRRIAEIKSALLAGTTDKDRDDWHISRRTPRHYRHFPIKTHIEFKPDELDRRTVMELITTDRPGLLSHISQAFTDCGVRLMNAKIATLGARAEDVFYITDRNNQPLTGDEQRDCLVSAIHKYLDSDTPL